MSKKKGSRQAREDAKGQSAAACDSEIEKTALFDRLGVALHQQLKTARLRRAEARHRASRRPEQ